MPKPKVLPKLRSALLILVSVSCAKTAPAQSPWQPPPLPDVPAQPAWNAYRIVQPSTAPAARTQGLPPPPPGWTAAEFANFGTAQEPLVPDYLDQPLSTIRSHKDGFFQKASTTVTWLDRGTSHFGVVDVDVLLTVALPAPTAEWPLLITPRFGLHLFDGPVVPDLPPQVYDGRLEFLWIPKINERWQLILEATPGVYSDFDGYDDEAFRMTGKGLARYQWVPARWELLFGILYVNRGDITLLPAGGLIWTPNEDVRYEMLFPRPKLAHRITQHPRYEDWWYVAGEFGGDSWSIRRTSGMRDQITLRDYRFLVGLERKLDGGAGTRLEVGYVFGRTIEYASATPDFEPGETVLLRGGLTY